MGERILARERATEFRERARRERGSSVRRWRGRRETRGPEGGARGEEDAVASRFGEAFARTSRNAFWKDMSTEKVSDATRRRCFRAGGAPKSRRRPTKTTAPTNADETSGAKNETFIVDVDAARSSHGRSQTYISQEVVRGAR